MQNSTNSTDKTQYRSLHFRNEDTPANSDEMVWGVMHCSRHKFPKFGSKDRRQQLFAWEQMNDFVHESFVPIAQKVSTVRGSRKIISSLAIPMIVFAHDTRENLKKMVEADIGIQFKQLKGKRAGELTTIPSDEMSNFINAITNFDVERFYSPEEYSKLHIHQRIKIFIGNEWCVGEIQKIQGSKRPRLLVSIPNLMMASTSIDLKNHEFIELAD